MSRAHRAILLAAGCVATVSLVGCTASGTVSSVPSSSSSPSTEPAPPSSAPPSPDPLPECEASIERAVDRLVGRQLTAFAEGDFRAAYALSSRSFRAEVDRGTFRRIVESGYPEVADPVDHAIADCRQPEPGVVLALVTVTGRNGRTVDMAYRFALEAGGWRVEGASPPRTVTTA